LRSGWGLVGEDGLNPQRPSRFLSARPKCCCAVRCGPAKGAMISSENPQVLRGRWHGANDCCPRSTVIVAYERALMSASLRLRPSCVRGSERRSVPIAGISPITCSITSPAMASSVGTSIPSALAVSDRSATNRSLLCSRQTVVAAEEWAEEAVHYCFPVTA
jgi:hypothetical protein